MVNLNGISDISVTVPADIEGAPTEINNNNTSFTYAFFQFITDDIFNRGAPTSFTAASLLRLERFRDVFDPFHCEPFSVSPFPNLSDLSVTRSTDIEGAPTEINNNNTSFTAASLLRLERFRDIFASFHREPFCVTHFRSTDIEGAPTEINNNNTSFTAASLLRLELFRVVFDPFHCEPFSVSPFPNLSDLSVTEINNNNTSFTAASLLRLEFFRHREPIIVTPFRFTDIEGAPTEINNNNTSFTAASFFQFPGDKFNEVVASLRRRITVPVCRYLNKVVDSLGRKFNVICDNIGRVLFREEAQVMISTLGYIIAILLAFTEIKSQGNPEFPFQTNPKAIMVSVNSVVIYGFTSTAEVVISAAGFDRTSIFALITRMGRMASLCTLVTSLEYMFCCLLFQED